jgi:steroid delta-isomerase-like uncharacterized protein
MMPRYLTIVIVCLVPLCAFAGEVTKTIVLPASQTPASEAHPPLLDANKALIHRFVEEVQNQHQVDAIDKFLAPSFVNHDPLPGLPGTVEGAKQFHRMLFAAFPDLHMIVHDQAAEGDKVWTRKTATGTHRGEFLGISASGKSIAWKIIDIMTIQHGKITEHWVVADVLGLMQQLGAVPQ